MIPRDKMKIENDQSTTIILIEKSIIERIRYAFFKGIYFGCSHDCMIILI